MMTAKEAREAGHGGDSQAFADFYNAVDHYYGLAMDGLRVEDVKGDWPSADMFAEGMDPDEAARELLPTNLEGWGIDPADPFKLKPLEPYLK